MSYKEQQASEVTMSEIEITYTRLGTEASDFATYYYQNNKNDYVRLFFSFFPPLGLFFASFCVVLFARQFASFHDYDLVFSTITLFLCGLFFYYFGMKTIKIRLDAFKEDVKCILTLDDEKIRIDVLGVESKTQSWLNISQAIYYKNSVAIFYYLDPQHDFKLFIQTKFNLSNPSRTPLLFAIVTSNAFTKLSQRELIELINKKIKSAEKTDIKTPE